MVGLINSMHHRRSHLHAFRFYTSMHRGTKTNQQQRECSDRYCINCICVVLHFINLIKISPLALDSVRCTCKVSQFFFLLRHVRDVNYYFNNKSGSAGETVWKTRIVQSIASCLSSSEAFRVSKCCREAAASNEIAELAWVDGLSEGKEEEGDMWVRTRRSEILFMRWLPAFASPFLIIIFTFSFSDGILIANMELH